MEGVEAILLEDITSLFLKKSKKITYGKRGERITIIADHGNIKIVRSKTGERFPVNIQSLKILSNGKNQ